MWRMHSNDFDLVMGNCFWEFFDFRESMRIEFGEFTERRKTPKNALAVSRDVIESLKIFAKKFKCPKCGGWRAIRCQPINL